jgi:hypothetical protein
VNNISISGKKTLFFINDAGNPLYEKITFDHTHIMEKAVFSTSLLGFMLRDLNCELASRFVDELLLKDRNAKALASPLITTRANMGAHIGEGNCHLAKYSLMGHIYILSQVIIEEAQKMALSTDADNISTNFVEMLSRPLHTIELNASQTKYHRSNSSLPQLKIVFKNTRMTTKLDHSSTLLNGDVKRHGITGYTGASCSKFQNNH